MIPWLAGGILGVVVLALAMSGLASAKPAQIARFVRWIGLAGLLALGALLFVRKIYVLAFLSWAAAFLVGRSIQQGGLPRAGAGGRTSDIETEWVRMSLDLESGATRGVVLKGIHSGRRLEDLSLDELRTVLAEARINDPDAARLIEAFIARAYPDAEQASAGAGEAPQAMTRDEALSLLGLGAGATAGEIRDAHRRLMQQVHPDKGGNDYLAAKINQARDLLLKLAPG